MGFYGDFHGISWWFNGNQWDFMGISWDWYLTNFQNGDSITKYDAKKCIGRYPKAMFSPNSVSFGVSAQIRFGAGSGRFRSGVVPGSSVWVSGWFLLWVPGWLREVRGGFHAGSRSFGEVPESCGAGSGLVLGASAGFRAVPGGSANGWLCFSATPTVHLRCPSLSSSRDTHTYTHCIGSKSSRAPCQGSRCFHIFQPTLLLGPGIIQFYYRSQCGMFLS